MKLLFLILPIAKDTAHNGDVTARTMSWLSVRKRDFSENDLLTLGGGNIDLGGQYWAGGGTDKKRLHHHPPPPPGGDKQAL